MMKRKHLLATLAAMSIACSVAGFAACAPKTPEAKEGTVYQTGVETFWVGVGKAYMTFDRVDGEQTFNVNVDAGDGYSAWLSGEWTLEEESGSYGELTLTATWEEGENATYLADAASGEAKSYTLAEGKYTIGVKIPSAGTINFKLDPVADKVGEGETLAPPTVCTEHKDENQDGKCDNCGAEMPSQEVSIMATLSAEVSTIKAKIELKSDNTWVLSMCYYGDSYTPSADGRWSMNTATYGITLTVENDIENMLAADSYDLAIDYTTQKYSAEISVTMPSTVPAIGGQALTFAFEQEAAQETEKQVEKTLNADNGAQKAKIELYSDKTWGISVCFYGDAYSPMVSGTWSLDTSTYNILLTVTGDEADVLAEETYTLNIDYTSKEYSISMTLVVPQAGTLSFDFNSAVVAETHYTVTFDLNYTNAPSGERVQTKTFKQEGVSVEYVETAPAVPTREGYKFAGWYTVKNPVLTNGAADTEYLFGLKLETAYNAPPSYLKNGVTAIEGDSTLYARWVQVKEISTAEQLREMANDLSGWYRLTSDITLTGEWAPIGLYYAYYEFYRPDWWLYAFRGTLEGNGHKITGLQLSTLDFADTAVSASEGSGDGTTAFFGSAVNCTVKDLTIENAKVTIADYEAQGHAYVSVLAAFVQGSNTLFENCIVDGADIDVSTNNIWYVSVAGLFGGHWGGNANGCDVRNTTIDVRVAFDKVLDGYSYEAVYVGGLVGEGYAWMNYCDADADISLTLNDTRAQAAVPVNVYLGGAMASSTYLKGITYRGNVSYTCNKTAGEASMYFGGLSGLQRYGYINDCLAQAVMTYTNSNEREKMSMNVGGILGANDTLYGVMGYAYFGIQNGCRVNNCIDASTYTKNEQAQTLEVIGKYALYDAEVKGYAQGLGADVSAFTNADGLTSNFFGAFNCVKVRSEAAQADANGTVAVAGVADLYGEAQKSVLGDGWTYTEGKLPEPKGTK